MKLYSIALLFLTLCEYKSNCMFFFDSDHRYERHLQTAQAQITEALLTKINLNVPLNTTSGLPPLLESLDKPQLYHFIEPLLRAGADPNNQNNSEQWSPLHYAATETPISYLRLLLDYKATINSVNRNHETPLMRAVRFGNYKIAQLLLQRGADPNIQDLYGDTALHTACSRYITYGENTALREKMIKLLLKYRANQFIKNKYGKTVLDLAQEQNFTTIVQLIHMSKIKFARQLLIILKKANILFDLNIAQRITDFVYNSQA